MEEVLSQLIKAKVGQGKIGLFSLPMGASVISHLLFADNVMIYSSIEKIC